MSDLGLFAFLSVLVIVWYGADELDKRRKHEIAMREAVVCVQKPTVTP